MTAGHQQPPSKGYILFTSLGGRLYAIIGIAFIAFFAVSFYQTFHLKRALESERALDLKHLAEVATGILQEEYAASEAGLIGAAEAKKRAALRLSKLRYDQEGYFWINDLEPKMIMHPMKPELDGEKLSDIKDPDGMPLFVEFVRLVKERGSGFVNYSWPKPGSQAPQPKLSYVAGFAPWGWVVGTGLYIDDLHQQVWSELKSGLGIIALVLLAIAGGALIFASSLSKSLTALTAVIAGVAKGNLEVPPAGTDDSTELGAIARAVEALRQNAIEQVALQAEVSASASGSFIWRLVPRSLRKASPPRSARWASKSTCCGFRLKRYRRPHGLQHWKRITPPASARARRTTPKPCRRRQSS
jgi:methyl-accepting chemotaxis protein